MQPRRSSLALIALCVLAFDASLAFAQRNTEAAYPVRPIRFIVPQTPGGTNDTMARFIGQHLADRLGKPVVIENRSGADGTIGAEIAARATADGHTLFMASSAFAMNPAVRNLPYDPNTAFTWIAFLGSGGNLLVTHPSFPAKTLKEVIAVGKSKPKYINLASTGATSTSSPRCFGRWRVWTSWWCSIRVDFQRWSISSAV